MKYIYTIAFLLLCITGYSQDITGIWRGSFNNVLYQRDGDGYRRFSLPTDDYKFEVQIAQAGNGFEAVTYSYLTTVFYGKATARGTVNKRNGKVFLEELKLVEVRMTTGNSACAMTLFLQYSKSGDEEFLEGTYTAMNISDSSRCPGGKVFLRKVITSDFYKEPMVMKREKEIEKEKKKNAVPPKNTLATKNNKPVPTSDTALKSNHIKLKPTSPVKNNVAVNKPPSKKTENQQNKTIRPSINSPKVDNSITRIDTTRKIERKTTPVVIPKVLSTRDNELVKTITTGENTITINIYDNGTIDNDTISVYLDKKLVVSKGRLSEKPIVVTLKLDETINYHELIMVAENLGDIPPNTSLMIVHAGSKQYEVRITSTEQKNAMVIFKYEKDKADN